MATLHIKALLDDSSEIKDTIQLDPNMPEMDVRKTMTAIAVRLAGTGVAESHDNDSVTVYPSHRVRQVTVERSRIDMPNDAQRGKILAGK